MTKAFKKIIPSNLQQSALFRNWRKLKTTTKLYKSPPTNCTQYFCINKISEALDGDDPIIQLEDLLSSFDDDIKSEIVDGSGGPGSTPLLHRIVMMLAKNSYPQKRQGSAIFGSHIIPLLLKHGADINQKDGKGQSALHFAVRWCREHYPKTATIPNSYADLVSGLLRHGACVNQRDRNGDTPLHFAAAVAATGGCGVVSEFLKHNANVLAVNNKRTTALGCAWSRFRRWSEGGATVSLLLDAFVRTLVATKSRTQARRWALLKHDEKGNTALHIATRLGRHRIVWTLLGLGADVNKENQLGETPLDSAANAFSGIAAMVRMLLDHGADINRVKVSNGVKLLPIARFLLNRKRCADADMLNATLHAIISTRYQKDEHVWFLLSSGADATNRNETALHVALDNDSSNELVHTILDQGVDANRVDCVGRAALHIAVMRCNTGMVGTLLDRGADVNQFDKDGRTPMPTEIALTQATNKLSIHGKGEYLKILGMLLDRGGNIPNETIRNSRTRFIMELVSCNGFGREVAEALFSLHSRRSY